MSLEVGKLFVSLGVDMSSFTTELVQAEGIASTSSEKIKNRFLTIATSLRDVRKQAADTKQALAEAGDFRLRGDAALDKLHEQLGKVRENGAASTKTLDEISLSFAEASRGAKTYTQALDKIAADKNASASVRELARALSDEAKEANVATAALQKQDAALGRMITTQSRALRSTYRQAQRLENAHQVPQQAAASAFVRGAEGTLSIRAGERFLTSTLGLGPALQALFPIAGGLAMIDIFGGLVEKTGEWHTKLQLLRDQPKVIAQAFQEMNQPIALANDQLRITNDRLANDIAKLEGKPENHLKEAIDEARLAADKLGESLTKDFGALQKLLQEHNIGAWQRLIGNVSTTNIQQDLFGKTGLGGVKAQVDDVTRASSQRQAQFAERLDGAKTKPEREAIVKESQQDLARSEDQIKGVLNPQIQKSDTHLSDLMKQQVVYSRYQSGDPGLRLAAIEETRRTGHAPEYTYDPSGAIEIEKTRNVLLHETRDDAVEQIKNSALTSKKETLQGNAAADSLTRPYQDKMHELASQLEGLKGNLAAIGRTETAETLATSFAAARQEITKLNDQLSKHHQSLTLDQQVDLVTVEDQITLTKSEEEWKKKLDQSTTSIENKVSTLKLLTDAIGKSASVQRTTAIEARLTETLGPKAQDPEWMRSHQGDVQTLRRSITTEVDTEHAHQGAQNVEKLSEEIQLEKSLAAAQLQGAEAVRLVTLAYRLRNLTMQGATPAQIKSEVALYDAQRKNQSAGNLAKTDQEISATERLTAAQLQGAEQVRQTQLQLKYEQMQREGASPQEIASTKRLDTVQHQQQVTAEAIRTGFSYQNQLQSIDEQVTALQQVRAQQGDSLAIETSLRSLELERSRILTEQVLLVGSAKDGMAAFFREMATEGQSAAEQVHEEFKAAFDGINDNLSRLMTGQKTNWASFLQSLGQQISKMSLQNLEHQIAAKVFTAKTPGIVAGQVGQRTAPGQSAAGKGGVIGFLGKILGPQSDTGKRDGNTPATALFVTMVGANGIPQWSTNRSQSGQTPPTIPLPGITVSSPAGGNKGSESPASPETMQTLQNGARQAPGIWGELAQAGVTLFQAFSKGKNTSGSGSSGNGQWSDANSGSLPSKVGDSVPGTGANAGTTLTRLPSGLILREPTGPNPGSGAAPSSSDSGTSGSSASLGYLYGAGNTYWGGPNPETLASVAGIPQADLPYWAQIRQIFPAAAGFPTPGFSAGLLPVFPGDSNLGTQANQGYQLTRMDSGLIARTPAESVNSSISYGGIVGDMPSTGSGHDGSSPGKALYVTPATSTSAGSDLLHTLLNKFLGGGQGSSSGSSGGLTDILSGLSGGGGGDAATSVESSISFGEPGAIDGGFFAAGGRPPTNKISLVGEKGPELFVPDRPGTIIPNHKLSSALTGGSRPGKNSMEALSAALGNKKFGGYRQAGGSVDPSNAYVVGEAGTEAFAYATPGGSSTTNHQEIAGNMMVVNVDARGATDPYLTRETVVAGIRAAHSSAIVHANQVAAERQKRIPQK